MLAWRSVLEDAERASDRAFGADDELTSDVVDLIYAIDVVSEGVVDDLGVDDGRGSDGDSDGSWTDASSGDDEFDELALQKMVDAVKLAGSGKGGDR